MSKSLHSSRYARFLDAVRAAREEQGVSQTELARRLKWDQSTISKCERGVRRLDVVELREWCYAMGISFPEFAKQLDAALPKPRAR